MIPISMWPLYLLRGIPFVKSTIARTSASLATKAMLSEMVSVTRRLRARLIQTLYCNPYLFTIMNYARNFFRQASALAVSPEPK
jgi:pantoate kinase